MMIDLIDRYINEHIEAEPNYLQEIFRKTNIRLLNPRMQSGHYQGRLLKFLTRVINPINVLEIGTFSAYSAICIAEGLSEKGHIDTIEINDELEDFINENIAISPHKDKITLHIGSALEIIPTIDKNFDMVFIDGNKREYIEYLNLVLSKLNKNGLIIADNTLWNGKVVEKIEHNDYQTQSIIEFNNYVGSSDCMEQIILPVRDGLSLIRVKNDII